MKRIETSSKQRGGLRGKRDSCVSYTKVHANTNDRKQPLIKNGKSLKERYTRDHAGLQGERKSAK